MKYADKPKNLYIGSIKRIGNFLGIYLKEKLKLTKAKVDHVLLREAYKSYKG